ncbi:MAG: NAD metabolism ATPase/kinase [Bacteroidetes bacterium]|nr:MAG: NAD metabolism ATPase/kinase [Bacteroidota bacterium]
MFTEKDLEQIGEKGIHIDELHRQIDHFIKGFPFADILAPASPGKGLICLNDSEEEHYRALYLQHADELKICRFIPASGAASRMFKALFAALDALRPLDAVAQEDWLNTHPEMANFFNHLGDYPFYEDLGLKENALPSECLAAILGPEGINYGALPKGLLKFHAYSPEDRRTAFEEHLREAVAYCADQEGRVYMHLTVSPAHKPAFEAEAQRVLPAIEAETGKRFQLSWSYQLPETDTLAVDSENRPFRTADGSLLFRPGGHGALIQNLAALDADLVFISNIDNVCPERKRDERIAYKQVLGGVLLEIRSRLFAFLRLLTDGRPAQSDLDAMLAFLQDHLGIPVPEMIGEETLGDWLLRTMNRPIRVCGMVRNEGEPGGGPFYVRNASGESSLQIVEGSQIDMDDPEKLAILKASTHFNPVDLVCGLRDFRGKKFELKDYIDPNTGFIAEKTFEGRFLKALELPGLWNGAMADWLTLFVEVPIGTFSPVKTVFDLIRSEHQTLV